MTEVLSPVAIQDFFINGIPAVGGKLFVYSAGTTTKITTYTDSTGGSAQTNPIIMNARGEPENTMGNSTGIWIPLGTIYKLVFSPSTDTDPPTNPIWTVDNISSGSLAPDNNVVLTWFYESSSPPSAAQKVASWAIPFNCTIPANFASPQSLFDCDTNPTATCVFGVLQNGAQIGTISVTTGGVATFATNSGLPVSLSATDRIQVIGPASPDATINEFFGTLIFPIR